jgi:hypothetical protein
MVESGRGNVGTGDGCCIGRNERSMAVNVYISFYLSRVLITCHYRTVNGIHEGTIRRLRRMTLELKRCATALLTVSPTTQGRH